MFEFRVLFALGVLAAAATLVISMQQPHGETSQPLARRASILEDLRQQEPHLRWTLIGTATFWFLFDVAYYGSTVFTPIILRDIFREQTLLSTSWQSAMTALMGVPGVSAAILLIQNV